MNPYLLIDIKQIHSLTKPTIVGYNPIESFIKKLSLLLTHKSLVICALESVKLSIPIWASAPRLSKKLKQALLKCIETIEKWVDGKAAKEEVNISANRAYMADNAVAIMVTQAAYAVSSNPIYNITKTITTMAHYQSGFLDEWWNKCQLLIGDELQDKLQAKYDIFCKSINGDL